jgi:hypothetical protein
MHVVELDRPVHLEVQRSLPEAPGIELEEVRRPKTIGVLELHDVAIGGAVNERGARGDPGVDVAVAIEATAHGQSDFR